ncbi:ParA family protein, partial [Roseibium sp.]
AILDADPNQPLASWAERTGESIPDELKIIAGVTEKNLLDIQEVEAEESDFVLIDLEGTASIAVSYSISVSDFVVIPCGGTQLDVDQAARVIALIRDSERTSRRTIPYALMFTRVNPAIVPRDLRHIVNELSKAKIPTFKEAVTQRSVYSTIFQTGGTIYQLTKDDASGIDKAITNAEAVAQELINKLVEVTNA